MKFLSLGLLSASLLLPIAGFSQTYSTNFDSTQNPISEGGEWLNGKTVGLDWYDIATYSGISHGTNTVAQYSDPTAILKGSWPADQWAQATVYSVNPTGTLYQEVELRLRSTMTAHSCRGYEIFFRCLKTSAAYAQIVRWNGPLADFTYLASNSGSQYGVTNGDVVKATIVGNVITAYINGVQKAQATDNTYSNGNPGIGFNYGCNGTYADFGFTNYSAGAINGTAVEMNGVEIAASFSLGQNTPNPFNPATLINFSVPAKMLVSLKVYDLRGRERASLMDKVVSAGAHAVTLKGAGLPAGVYFYRLKAGHFVQTKKLVVQR